MGTKKETRVSKKAWSEEMELKYQSVFKNYPNRSASGEARMEFAKLNPDAALLKEITAALDWQIPVFEKRARRSGTVAVVPHFRRWLHNRWWEEEELDGFKRVALDACPKCKHKIARHAGKECADCVEPVGPCSDPEKCGYCKLVREEYDAPGCGIHFS